MPPNRPPGPRPAPRPCPERPLYAVHGSTLIAAPRRTPDPTHPPRPRAQATTRARATSRAQATSRNPYVRLFAPPGARAFTLGNLLARLPMGMFTVSTVLMIVQARGSYALAGAVTASGLAATAVVAPLTARLVDRYGQARIALPATLIALLGSLALVACVSAGAPAWTFFACYAATATTPNTGGMSRARWAHLHRADPAARHTANSFEQAADELCFMLGPVLATVLCTALHPAAGTLTGCALLLTGMLLFTAQRATEPPLAPAGATPAPTPLRRPGMPPLLLTFLATGAVFGALEVVTLGHADGQGKQGLAGVILACQAGGSALAGLAFGALRPRGELRRRFTLCVGAMAALLTLPLLAAHTGGLLLLAAALLVAGMATAPTMVTGMTLVQRLTPRARLNEGMTLAVTALLGGIAAGSAAGGWAIDHLGTTAWAYLTPCTAATLAAVLALRVARTKPTS